MFQKSCFSLNRYFLQLTKFQMESNLRYRISPFKLNTSSLSLMESIQLDMSHSIFDDVHNQSLMRDQEIERISSRYETENIMITIEELGLDSLVKTNSNR